MRIKQKKIDKKTRELFLYIANKLKDADGYGATLLNKAFYYIDFIYYARTKTSISSFKYIKQNFGPTPEPSEFLRLKNSLIRDDAIKETTNEYYEKKQKRCIPQIKSDISVFNKKELEFMDKILKELHEKNASEISELTHNHLSWKFARDKEELPLYTILLTKKKPNEEDIEWATTRIEKYRLCSNN